MCHVVWIQPLAIPASPCSLTLGHSLELCPETIQKLKSSLCLFARQHCIGSASKIASWLLLGFEGGVESHLQSIRDFQGWDIFRVGPCCSIPAALGRSPRGISMALSPHAGLVRIFSSSIIEPSELVYGCVGS